MAALSSLPPDQKAVLQLVLGQGRSYDDIAGLLGLDEAAVRRRAHQALTALGPAERPAGSRLGEIADFLLGQSPVSAREDTRRHLAASATARAWAAAVRDELAPLAGEDLPELPDGDGADDAPAPAVLEKDDAADAPLPPTRIPPRRRAPEPEPARVDEDEDVDAWLDELEAEEAEERTPAAVGATRPARRERRDGDRDRGRDRDGRRGGSRLGGALLLGGLGVLLAALIVFLVGRDDEEDPPARSGDTTARTQPAGEPELEAQVNLRGEGEAVGVAQVARQGERRLVIIQGEDVPANREGRNRDAYAIWLSGGEEDPIRLGFVPEPVTRRGTFLATGPLPDNADAYSQLLITRETSNRPRRPGATVLRGDIELEPLSGGGGGEE